MIQKCEAFLAWGGTRKDIVLLVISGLSLIGSMLGLEALAWVSIVLCGIPIILEAIIGLVTAFDIKADVLVSIALVASVAIGEYFAAGEVAFIMQLGGLLEDLTVLKAQAGIEKLVSLTPLTARSLVDGKEEMIESQYVAVGDILRVLPGESIPVDGRIVRGATSINQAVMTGESLPVDKTVGDEVSSGTVNLYGTFDMQALRVGQDSSIQRMIALVQSADASKAKIVSFADRFATWVVVIALTAALGTYLVTSEIIRPVTILVVFCPCALVLATPTAIMAAIGNATRHGFLVSVGDALERLSQVKIMTFDKTGTLTYGRPQVKAVHLYLDDMTEAAFYRKVASLERFSEHPLGKAIVQSYLEAYQGFDEIDGFKAMTGKGVEGYCEGECIRAGNERLVPVTLPVVSQPGQSVIYVSIGGRLAGYLILADQVREQSPAMIQELQRLGISPILLTGDQQATASQIASQLGITNIHAQCLPEDKLKTIETYQEAGKPVCMIGDGMNDAPALKKANVGIAMGGIGSDIAVDAADIVLVEDQVEQLPHLFALSRRMMQTIRINLTFSMTLNIVAIILAMTGWLNPVIGALVHNAGSVLVIINAAFLMRYRYKKDRNEKNETAA